MLVSAPATAALDALFASLAPALGGESFRTSTTSAFQNVLDDLTLSDDAELGGNAKQQSSAVPEPASKKQSQAATSLTDISAMPQTGIQLAHARQRSPETGRNTLSDDNTACDAGPSQSTAGDSGSALPLHEQPATTGTASQTVPAEQEGALAHATVSTPRFTISSGAPSNAKLVAKTVFGGQALTNLSSRAAIEPAAVRSASETHATSKNAAENQTATTADAVENERIPARVAAASSPKTPTKASISNPAPPVERSTPHSITGSPSAMPHVDEEEPDIIHQDKIDQDQPEAILTTQSAKNSTPAALSAPVAPEQLARTDTTPAASASARPAIRPDGMIRPDAIAKLPIAASPEVRSANLDAIGTPAAGAGRAISSESTMVTPSQQPAAKPNTSASASETQPAAQLPAGASSFTTPSTKPEFLTALAPVAAGSEQTAQAPTPELAANSSAAIANPDPASEAQEPATPALPVTTMPATAPAMPASPVPSMFATTPSPVATAPPATDRTTAPSLNAPSGIAGATPAAKSPLLPQAENFAFAVRLLGQDDSSSRSSVTQPSAALSNGEQSLTQALTETKQPAPQPQNSPAQQTAAPQVQSTNQQNTNQATQETQPAAPTPGKPETVAQNQTGISAPPNPGQSSHPADTQMFQVPQPATQVESPASGLEHSEGAAPDVPLAAQQARFAAPELPRSSASSEILLHLTSDGQTPAAIRVADRAGSVNVSVHAADPVLRESLRTNLGDLSAQLNLQGWKTETTKSAAVAAHSDNPQDSHAGGQRGSGQQASGGERQPQRERRGNAGQWREAFNQQIIGNQTNPGGNR